MREAIQKTHVIETGKLGIVSICNQKEKKKKVVTMKNTFPRR